MAIDKAVDSAALEAGLTKVANAIRTKGGTSAQLAFPDGMATAVAAIEAGGEAKEPYIEYTYTTVSGEQYMQTAKMHGHTVVPYYAFYNQSQLQDVAIAGGITSVGADAFYRCSKLALISLPEGLTSIGASAFASCTGLKGITFKGTPETIGANAFNRCANLLTINVPWAEGAVANAPWGATNATINYNYTEAV